jgi:hypothetical protein
MSNGFSGLGGIEIKQDEGIYGLFVRQCWSSASSWTELNIRLGDNSFATLDMDNDDARQLAALLLEAAGNKDLADAIPADMARREARAREQQDALTELCAIQAAADKAFNEATRVARAAHKATMDDAERLYGEAAGCRMARTIIVNEDDLPL